MSKKTVKDIDVKGKKVLVRCDFNVPYDENRVITDNRRIVAALPTIKYILEKTIYGLAPVYISCKIEQVETQNIQKSN